MKTTLSVLSCAAIIGIACVACGPAAWANGDDDGPVLRPKPKRPPGNLNIKPSPGDLQEARDEEKNSPTKFKKGPTYKKSTLSKEQADAFLQERDETSAKRKTAEADMTKAWEEMRKETPNAEELKVKYQASKAHLESLERQMNDPNSEDPKGATLRYKAAKIIHDTQVEPPYEEAAEKLASASSRYFKAKSELAEANQTLADIPRQKLIWQRANYLANKVARQQANPLNVQTNIYGAAPMPGGGGIYTPAPTNAVAAPTQQYGAAPRPNGQGNYTPAPARGAQ